MKSTNYYNTLIEVAEDCPSKVGWYVVSVKLDLEARNIIERIQKTNPHKFRMKK